MSSKTSTTVVRLIAVERESTSRNGNPTYLLTDDLGKTWRTKRDGQVGYVATNYAPRAGGSRIVELTADSTGHVIGIESVAMVTTESVIVNGPPAVVVRSDAPDAHWKNVHRDAAAKAYGTTRGKVHRVLELTEGRREHVSAWYRK